jgi:hypothetical protein
MSGTAGIDRSMVMPDAHRRKSNTTNVTGSPDSEIRSTRRDVAA